MADGDLEQWARAMAPSVFDDEWAWLIDGTPAEIVTHDIRHEGGMRTVRGDALLDYVRELADRAAMLQRRYGGNERFRNEVGLTPLYRAVLRALEARKGSGWADGFKTTREVL